MQSAPTPSSPPPLLQGISGSLIGARGLIAISFATLFSAARGVLTREDSDRRIRWWARDVVSGLNLDVRVTGHEHYEAPGQPFIVMSNHQSHYDIPLLFFGVGPDIRMVTKAELFRVPIWGPAMKRAGFIELDRTDRRRAMRGLQSAREQLTQGVRVWIAPEGTRSRTGALLPFKKGGFLLSVEAGVPILPVGIVGTRDILPADALLSSRNQHVGIAIGAPLSPAGKSRDALMNETRLAIDKLMTDAEALRA